MVVSKEKKITRLTKQLSELKPDPLQVPLPTTIKKHIMSQPRHRERERKRRESTSSSSSSGSESEHEVIIVRKHGKPRREQINEHIEYSKPKEIKERYIPPPKDDRPKINFS